MKSSSILTIVTLFCYPINDPMETSILRLPGSLLLYALLIIVFIVVVKQVICRRIFQQLVWLSFRWANMMWTKSTITIQRLAKSTTQRPLQLLSKDICTCLQSSLIRRLLMPVSLATHRRPTALSTILLFPATETTSS